MTCRIETRKRGLAAEGLGPLGSRQGERMALAQQCRERVRGNRSTEEIALYFVAIVRAEEGELLAGLDTFGDDRETEAVR